MIAHIVLFNPKSNATPEVLLSCAQLLERLAREVPGVIRASAGRSIALDPGYPRSFGEKTYQNVCVVEFGDRESLLNYLNHPIHRELGRLFWEMCDSAIVTESEMVDAKTESLARFLV
jgi:Stress responsive A/B Barrel Domain